MIQLHPVTDPGKLNFGFKQIYEASFPEDERREWNQLLELLGNKQICLNEIYDQKKFLGFITIWYLTEFNFIEHFAILDTEQRKGYGSQTIEQILALNPIPVILEVEEPLTEVARKRISFYERHNFKANDFNYFQPSYSVKKHSVKMLLMSYPSKIYPEIFKKIEDQIYDRVYGCKT